MINKGFRLKRNMLLLNKLDERLASHSTAPTKSPITRVQINKGFRLKRISLKILSFGTMAATSRGRGLECFRMHNFTTDLFAATRTRIVTSTD